jgi:hypothetical protein
MYMLKNVMRPRLLKSFLSPSVKTRFSVPGGWRLTNGTSPLGLWIVCRPYPGMVTNPCIFFFSFSLHF